MSLPCTFFGNAAMSNTTLWKWGEPRVDVSSDWRKSADAAGRKWGSPLFATSNSLTELFRSVSRAETDKPNASPKEPSDKNVLNGSHSNC